MTPFELINRPATHAVTGTDKRGARFYYTGRTGDGWVTSDPAEAFVGWYESGAAALAERLNKTTPLHGITFEPIAGADLQVAA